MPQRAQLGHDGNQTWILTFDPDLFLYADLLSAPSKHLMDLVVRRRFRRQAETVAQRETGQGRNGGRGSGGGGGRIGVDRSEGA